MNEGSPDSEDLLHRLEGAVQRCLRLTDAAALEFDASLPSLALVALLHRQGDVPIHLIHLRPTGSPAPELVRRHARHYGFALVERISPPADEARHRHAVQERAAAAGIRLTPRSVDALTTFSQVAHEAAFHASRLILLRGWGTTGPATGAEHEERLEGQLAAHLGLQLRYPFLDPRVVMFTRERPRAEALIDALRTLDVPTDPSATTPTPVP